jgi:hypothetical protein
MVPPQRRMQSPSPSELQELLEFLTPQELAEVDRLLKAPTLWEPLPGPQTEALSSGADFLFYGGAAGGGKTDLLLGADRFYHWRSIIFRRVFPSLRAIIDRSRQIYNPEGSDTRKRQL